jgi:hypothetical protein
MISVRGSTLLFVAALLVAGTTVAGCADEDEGPTSTASALTEADPEPDPDPEADPEAANAHGDLAPGGVEPKSTGATQVDITLREWEVAPVPSSARAGKIYFLVRNEGPDDPHEFVVVRTSRPVDELPIVDGAVDESLVNVIDQLEPFTPGTTASIELDLEPGDYVLLCNIAEVEEGEIESHVELGMRTAFKVE